MKGIPDYLKDDDHTDYDEWKPKTDEEEKEKQLILNIHDILKKGFTAKALSKNFRYNNDEFKKTPKQIINLINRKKVDYNLLDSYLGNAVINYNKNNFFKIYQSILSNQSKLDNKKMVEIYNDIDNIFSISCFFCKKENEDCIGQAERYKEELKTTKIYGVNLHYIKHEMNKFYIDKLNDVLIMFEEANVICNKSKKNRLYNLEQIETLRKFYTNSF